MKALLLFIILMIGFVQAARTQDMERVNEINRLLNPEATLSEKAQGLSAAKMTDAPEVNDALAALLDDESEGGRVLPDVAIEKPWIEALHILVRRFPEAGVAINRDYRYTVEDKNRWRKWWFANRASIDYPGDGTHRVPPSPTAGPPPPPNLTPAPPPIELTPENSPRSPSLSPSVEAQAPAEPTPEPTLSAGGEKPSDTTSRLIWAVGALGVLGLLFLALKLRS